MVVTGSDLVEQRRMDLSPERLAIFLFEINRDLQSPAIDVKAEFTLVGEQSVRDDVSRDLAIEPENQITGQ